MILRSSSGYCMPFEEPIKQDVQMSLGYGEQKNPVTGETFFHHGIDFSVNHYLLSAVATGTVSAIGSDAEHGIYQTIPDELKSGNSTTGSYRFTKKTHSHFSSLLHCNFISKKNML